MKPEAQKLFIGPIRQAIRSGMMLPNCIIVRSTVFFRGRSNIGEGCSHGTCVVYRRNQHIVSHWETERPMQLKSDDTLLLVTFDEDSIGVILNLVRSTVLELLKNRIFPEKVILLHFRIGKAPLDVMV